MDKILKQFAVYDSDISVTMKKGQDHETWYELLDPKQGYNQAEFERPPLNSVPPKKKKPTLKVFLSNQNTYSFEYV